MQLTPSGGCREKSFKGQKGKGVMMNFLHCWPRVSSEASVPWHCRPVKCMCRAGASNFQKLSGKKIASASRWKSGWHEPNQWGQGDICHICCKGRRFTRQRPEQVFQEEVCTQRQEHEQRSCKECDGVRFRVRPTRI